MLIDPKTFGHKYPYADVSDFVFGSGSATWPEENPFPVLVLRPESESSSNRTGDPRRDSALCVRLYQPGRRSRAEPLPDRE